MNSKGYATDAAALSMAARVFSKKQGVDLEQDHDASSLLSNSKSWHERNTDESFLKRKIAAHIKKKSKWMMESMAKRRSSLANDLHEDLDCMRISNNMSLQISRHTSRHSRMGDDSGSSTDDDDDSDSFCGDELEPAVENDEIERLSEHSMVK